MELATPRLLLTIGLPSLEYTFSRGYAKNPKMEYKTSVEVARRFNIGLNTLTSYLTRHPHLRPQRRAGTSFLWTDEEIERLAQHRARAISRGRKRAED